MNDNDRDHDDGDNGNGYAPAVDPFSAAIVLIDLALNPKATKVALKKLKPELTRDERGLRRFEKEAASALNHPNILTIYEFGQVDGLRYIAAELIEGQTALSRNL